MSDNYSNHGDDGDDDDDVRSVQSEGGSEASVTTGVSSVFQASMSPDDPEAVSLEEIISKFVNRGRCKFLVEAAPVLKVDEYRPEIRQVQYEPRLIRLSVLEMTIYKRGPKRILLGRKWVRHLHAEYSAHLLVYEDAVDDRVLKICLDASQTEWIRCRNAFERRVLAETVRTFNALHCAAVSEAVGVSASTGGTVGIVDEAGRVVSRADPMHLSDGAGAGISGVFGLSGYLRDEPPNIHAAEGWAVHPNAGLVGDDSLDFAYRDFWRTVESVQRQVRGNLQSGSCEFLEGIGSEYAADPQEEGDRQELLVASLGGIVRLVPSMTTVRTDQGCAVKVERFGASLDFNRHTSDTQANLIGVSAAARQTQRAANLIRFPFGVSPVERITDADDFAFRRTISHVFFPSSTDVLCYLFQISIKRTFLYDPLKKEWTEQSREAHPLQAICLTSKNPHDARVLRWTLRLANLYHWQAQYGGDSAGAAGFDGAAGGGSMIHGLHPSVVMGAPLTPYSAGLEAGGLDPRGHAQIPGSSASATLVYMGAESERLRTRRERLVDREVQVGASLAEYEEQRVRIVRTALEVVRVEFEEAKEEIRNLERQRDDVIADRSRLMGTLTTLEATHGEALATNRQLEAENSKLKEYLMKAQKTIMELKNKIVDNYG